MSEMPNFNLSDAAREIRDRDHIRKHQEFVNDFVGANEEPAHNGNHVMLTAIHDLDTYVQGRPANESELPDPDSHYNATMGKTIDQKNVRELADDWASAEADDDKTRINDVEPEITARVLKAHGAAEGRVNIENVTRERAEREIKAAYALNALVDRNKRLKRKQQGKVADSADAAPTPVAPSGGETTGDDTPIAPTPAAPKAPEAPTGDAPKQPSGEGAPAPQASEEKPKPTAPPEALDDLLDFGRTPLGDKVLDEVTSHTDVTPYTPPADMSHTREDNRSGLKAWWESKPGHRPITEVGGFALRRVLYAVPKIGPKMIGDKPQAPWHGRTATKAAPSDAPQQRTDQAPEQSADDGLGVMGERSQEGARPKEAPAQEPHEAPVASDQSAEAPQEPVATNDAPRPAGTAPSRRTQRGGGRYNNLLDKLDNRAPLQYSEEALARIAARQAELDKAHATRKPFDGRTGVISVPDRYRSQPAASPEAEQSNQNDATAEIPRVTDETKSPEQAVLSPQEGDVRDMVLNEQINPEDVDAMSDPQITAFAPINQTPPVLDRWATRYRTLHGDAALGRRVDYLLGRLDEETGQKDANVA